eukprot:scaffold476_cov111-Isochrysis_galbana.AAC.2
MGGAEHIRGKGAWVLGLGVGVGGGMKQSICHAWGIEVQGRLGLVIGCVGRRKTAVRYRSGWPCWWPSPGCAPMCACARAAAAAAAMWHSRLVAAATTSRASRSAASLSTGTRVAASAALVSGRRQGLRPCLRLVVGVWRQRVPSGTSGRRRT